MHVKYAFKKINVSYGNDYNRTFFVFFLFKGVLEKHCENFLGLLSLVNEINHSPVNFFVDMFSSYQQR